MIPTSELGGLSSVHNFLLERAFSPHIESFNFALKDGLDSMVENLEPISFKWDNKIIKFWIDYVHISPPLYKTTDDLMYPRDARLSAITYSAVMNLRLGFEALQYVSNTEDGQKSNSTAMSEVQMLPPFFVNHMAGRIPIMVRSKFCNLQQELNRLHDKWSKKPDLKNFGSHSAEQYQKEVCKILRLHGEDDTDQGGYWIINGVERFCRLLIMQRANYPICVSRHAYSKSGSQFSPHTVSIRCTRPDFTCVTNTLHYLTSGDVLMRFLINRRSFFIPAVLLLKSLKCTTDREIYQLVVQNNSNNTLMADRVKSMLRLWQNSEIGSGLNMRSECLEYLGSTFRSALNLEGGLPNVEVGHQLLRRYILVHLDEEADKFHTLIFMVRKVYALAIGEITSENLDSPSNQEILLPGHLYLMILRESMQTLLRRMYKKMVQMTQNSDSLDLYSESTMRKIVESSGDVGSRLEYFLATGNIGPWSDIEVRQGSGFSVVAERLNYLRFVSHFRSVHRGQFYTQLRTTDIRKLQPESWGFFCPVHTPDGASCGLLNHLALSVGISMGLGKGRESRHSAVASTLFHLGMVDINEVSVDDGYLHVLLDGRVLGAIPLSNAEVIQDNLRLLKVWAAINDADSDVVRWINASIPSIIPSRVRQRLDGLVSPFLKSMGTIDSIPWDMEICLVGPNGRQFPGLYLFSSPSRLIRFVYNNELESVEVIGTFEQVYLNIHCPDLNSHNSTVEGGHATAGGASRPFTSFSESAVSSRFTHSEIDPNYIFSLVGSLTPFSEYNQSPRNMYQCQMSKQSMGTPVFPIQQRADSKIYHLTCPQIPLTRTRQQDLVDSHPNGINAIVAVISYTGYDMEDAMIIGKSSSEFGWGTGYVYKTQLINLVADGKRDGDAATKYFNNIKNLKEQQGEPEPFDPNLDFDGLPSPGQRICKGDSFYVTYSESDSTHHIVKYKNNEPILIDDVIISGVGNRANINLNYIQKVLIKCRIYRPGVRGDKFSSRHGQKGVLSQRWPQIDMPFCENGIVPDIIINPNAFPSRMTIGMLIESMAGKAATLSGKAVDATPFGYDEKHTAADYFGRQLVKNGYNYYGNETMYSGITGEPFQTDIFIGVVHYQRLRHMVGDKYQVRSTGTRNRLTNQPVKGRKKGGGIRFGEMERDSLLAHGVSNMLHDRLFNCSDRSKCYACIDCGSITSTLQDRKNSGEFHTYLNSFPIGEPLSANCSQEISWKCTLCDSSKGIVVIEIPFVLRYLVSELTSMNIRLSLDIRTKQ